VDRQERHDRPREGLIMQFAPHSCNRTAGGVWRANRQITGFSGEFPSRFFEFDARLWAGPPRSPCNAPARAGGRRVAGIFMDVHEQQRALRNELERRGISDRRVLDSIEHTRRDLFVPEEERSSAYADTALAIGHSQTISQPYIVALMTEALGLTGRERVLEIGTGSGYQGAVLSPLCREIVTIERIAPLSEGARNVHEVLGYRNIVYRVGDGTLGCPELAPFDGILVTAAAPEIPEPLYQQLKPGGRMIIPVGDESEQDLLRVVRNENHPEITVLCGCRFVRLIGAAGWAS
jgi:protein-L-isoaspartate(D-aspartate) O-methyltransferase